MYPIEFDVDQYLYDLACTPCELTNLIEYESHREVAHLMRERVVRRTVDAGEPVPVIESVPLRPGGQRHVLPEEVQT